MNKPLAWKQYTKPLERRLAHLVSKKTANSFDKQEASALRHVLEIVSQPQRQPLTDEPTPDHDEGFEGSIRIFLKKKNGQWERLETLEQSNEYNRQKLTQRQWIGLTTDDWQEIQKQAKYHWEMTTGEYAERISHLVEDKLREKNT